MHCPPATLLSSWLARFSQSLPRNVARRATRDRQSAQVALADATLEDRVLLAAVSWDGGGGDLNWNTAANWSDDIVPDADDDVTINLNDNNLAVSIANSTIAVNSLNSQSKISVFRSTVQFDGASAFTNGIDLMESTLQLGGSLTLTGTSSAYFSTITSPSNAVLTNEGELTIGAYLIFRDTDFLNAAGGQVTQATQNIGYTRVIAGGTVTIANEGDWDFEIEENRSGEIYPENGQVT
ncbi:MAG: hypothetical protein JNL58_23060, partial [Planctomyces sp.]|nr:hypothetical protein [Planctomyces sp.]